MNYLIASSNVFLELQKIKTAFFKTELHPKEALQFCILRLPFSKMVFMLGFSLRAFM